MKKIMNFVIFILILLSCASESKDTRGEVDYQNTVIEFEDREPLQAFPANTSFNACIKPNHKSQKLLNEDVVEYYHYWRNKYVRKSNGHTPGGGYYVYMKGTGGDGSEITTSEAHGYGMIILALMAGAESNAKKYFDGMYNMYDMHRSTNNEYCMSWIIHETEKSKYDKGSASDGDLDIAYALLLADKQWASDGNMNYLAFAKELIEKGLKKSIVHPVSKRIMLGDWDTDPYSTRSSDWMTGHFHTFQKVTDDPLWTDVSNEAYRMIASLTNNYAVESGLMPDFVVGQLPKPAPEYYLDEFKETDEYCWNACRYPWRIAADFAHFNTPEAKAALLKINGFIRSKTNEKPELIKAGYYLNGNPMVDYTSGAFTAPLITTCMVDAEAQAYLNKGWEIMKNTKESYFADTICLLNMLLISGNWWNPVAE